MFTWKPDKPITGKNALEISLSLDGVDGEYGIMCYTAASKSTTLETEEVKSSCGTFDFVLDKKDEYSFDFVVIRDSITHKLLIEADNDIQIYNNVYAKVTDQIVAKQDKIMLVTITDISLDYNPTELVKGSITFTPSETVSSTDIVFTP